MIGGIGLRRLGVDDAAAVQALVETDPGYALRISGHLPDPHEGLEILTSRPPGLAAEHKVVLGAFDDRDPDQLLAVIDLLRGWPEPGTVHVGLLQVRAASHGQGVGRRAHEQLLATVRGWPEVTALRAAIVETNAEVAARFWAAIGYRPTGAARPFPQRHRRDHRPGVDIGPGNRFEGLRPAKAAVNRHAVTTAARHLPVHEVRHRARMTPSTPAARARSTASQRSFPERCGPSSQATSAGVIPAVDGYERAE